MYKKLLYRWNYASLFLENAIESKSGTNSWWIYGDGGEEKGSGTHDQT